jgi:ATP-dependent protease ClpP protease subunit
MDATFINYGGVSWVQIKSIVPQIINPVSNGLDYLVNQYKGKFLPVWVSSTGGDFYVMTAIVDLLQEYKNSGIPIVTATCGYGAMSGGVNVFAMGDVRYATPNSRFMIHHASFGQNKQSMTFEYSDIKEYTPEQIKEFTEDKTRKLYSHLEYNLDLDKGELVKWMQSKCGDQNEYEFETPEAKEINLVTSDYLPDKNQICKDLKDIDRLNKHSHNW